ncbi:hypothetical protein C7974DRAFT_95655 [Boeremia exigua]|uniref:uncharacterized protein n=1 Tax=Boeremia exigua TaxID=749465 RepID=UPI001E8E1FED|nr:uncharacterized protein C7974DRAFT_95655 [Boeremia exigua]KAH6642125.1 hypothetical protein C7974DRAFT_95655 [Boeremia exigua]
MLRSLAEGCFQKTCSPHCRLVELRPLPVDRLPINQDRVRPGEAMSSIKPSLSPIPTERVAHVNDGTRVQPTRLAKTTVETYRQLGLTSVPTKRTRDNTNAFGQLDMMSLATKRIKNETSTFGQLEPTVSDLGIDCDSLNGHLKASFGLASTLTYRPLFLVPNQTVQSTEYTDRLVQRYFNPATFQRKPFTYDFFGNAWMKGHDSLSYSQDNKGFHSESLLRYLVANCLPQVHADWIQTLWFPTSGQRTKNVHQ